MKLLRVAVLAVLAILGLWFVWAAILRFLSFGELIMEDFASYYSSASLALQGLDIYDDAAREAFRVQIGLAELPPYIYPPFLAVVLKPIALLPFGTARIIWFVTSSMALIVSLVLLARTFCLDRRWFLALVAAALFLPGTWLTLWLGQVNMFLLLLIALALYFERNDRQRAAGAALGLAIIIKLIPLLLIVYLALTRRFTTVLWSALALVGLTAFSIVAGGTDYQARFFTHGIVTAAGMNGVGMPFDQSISAYFARFFLPTPFSSPLFVSSQLPLLLTVAASALLLALTARDAVRGGFANILNGFPLTIVAMLLVSTISWDHYAVFLLVPLAALMRQPDITSSRPTFQQFAVLLAYGLLVIQGYWTVFPRSAWFLSFGFYGMVILWACFIWINRTHRPSGTSLVSEFGNL